MTPEQIAEEILHLTAPDLLKLDRILRDAGGDGLIGVREPRRPSPESPGDAIALDEEE